MRICMYFRVYRHICIGNSHLSLFQSFLVQLMNVLLLPPVGDVESLNCDGEVVLHEARIGEHRLGVGVGVP